MCHSHITAGLASGAAAQGAAASPSLEEHITLLGDQQRAALNQAQVLSRVAADMQASARLTPNDDHV